VSHVVSGVNFCYWCIVNEDCAVLDYLFCSSGSDPLTSTGDRSVVDCSPTLSINADRPYNHARDDPNRRDRP